MEFERSVRARNRIVYAVLLASEVDRADGGVGN